MPSGRKDIAEDGKATQFPNNDPTKGGRKPSIRTQLESFLLNDGGVKIPPDQVLKINDDGSVVINIPTSELMAMKLVSWAMSNKGGDSIKAIQMIMEQIDGKPTQPIEQSTEQTNTVNYKIINGSID